MSYNTTPYSTKSVFVNVYGLSSMRYGKYREPGDCFTKIASTVLVSRVKLKWSS